MSMRLGLGLGLPCAGRAGGAAAWTPANLFASGEEGAWYDPSALSTLWKDTAGTDPVTVDGDLVARIDDRSGNNNNLTQGTTSRCPAYKTSGGLHRILGDGVDDWLPSSKAMDLNVPEWWMWGAVARASGSGVILNVYGDDFQYLRIDDAQIFARAGVGSTNQVTKAITSVTSASVFLLRVRSSDRSVNIWRDGADLGSMTIPGASWWPTLSGMIFHAGISGAGPTASSVYEAGYIARALTTAEQDDLTAWNSAKAGV